MSFVKGKLPFKLKLIHGFGAVAFGIKDGGFLFFLLFYYSQVLGMDAGLVGLILLAAWWLMPLSIPSSAIFRTALTPVGGGACLGFMPLRYRLRLPG